MMPGTALSSAPGDPAAGQSPAPTPLPVPFQPLVDAIRTQMAAHTQDLAHAGKPGTDLMLHPAELGRIHFALTGTGHQLTITIGAENRDTLALLQRHAADLRAELSQDGLGQTAFSFTDLGQGGSGSMPTPMPAPMPPATDDAAPASPEALGPSPNPTRSPHDGALDLRL